MIKVGCGNVSHKFFIREFQDALAENYMIYSTKMPGR